MSLQPHPPETSLSLDQSHTLLTSFNDFLTVAIHNILYYRTVYPAPTFLSSRAYNLPVHQNRHPRVCTWIRDAVDAVAVQLAGGHVARVVVVIHSPLHPLSLPVPLSSSSPEISSLSSSSGDEKQGSLPPGTVLERWLFDVSRFPTWPASGTKAPGKAMRDYGRMLAKEARDEESRDKHVGDDAISWPDVDEQFRGALRRMAHAAEGMTALPEGCSFTVAVELRDEGRVPIGHPQAWIPSEPNLQPKSKSRNVPGEDIGGAKTTPIRSVEAGPLFFECWVEESKAKEALQTREPNSQEVG